MDDVVEMGGTRTAALEPLDVAAVFRLARLGARAIGDFPGPVPKTLAEAYATQVAAIAGWPDQQAGWKVGRITGEAETRFGTERLLGPVFNLGVQSQISGQTSVFAAITGGFCAVEAELIFRLEADAPEDFDADNLDWVAGLHAGVEIAGSPLATINDLGPTVVVSDFGNNSGLIVGPPVDGWRDRLNTIQAETWIDGVLVGTGSDAVFPGGVLASLAYAVRKAKQIGLPLKAGMLVSTGAITGVHDIQAGQRAEVRFGDEGGDGIIPLACVVATARETVL